MVWGEQVSSTWAWVSPGSDTTHVAYATSASKCAPLTRAVSPRTLMLSSTCASSGFMPLRMSFLMFCENGGDDEGKSIGCGGDGGGGEGRTVRCRDGVETGGRREGQAGGTGHTGQQPGVDPIRERSHSGGRCKVLHASHVGTRLHSAHGGGLYGPRDIAQEHASSLRKLPYSSLQPLLAFTCVPATDTPARSPPTWPPAQQAHRHPRPMRRRQTGLGRGRGRRLGRRRH